MTARIAALPLSLALLAALSAPAAAEALSGSQIEALIVGRTVHLSTPYGLELPLRYNPGGRVAGDVSGFSLAGMFTPREEGRWWIESDRLCQQWPTWYNGQVFCFSIKSIGSDRISWLRQDGLSGTARIEG